MKMMLRSRTLDVNVIEAFFSSSKNKRVEILITSRFHTCDVDDDYEGLLCTVHVVEFHKNSLTEIESTQR
ncbi:CLUMA_CG016777, isoform A [Clunio marinus]|uniref:CLUMA_CG016777, isoform A n=1 Tax=Clunio marinus TaxID=568069 RepID=A0A1J1ITJ2_9DIPT|nr:CLUMA_CG016777, isoform A [Clunio marinus]